jgi:hypothetical protein
MRFDFVLPVVYNDDDIRWNRWLGDCLERRGATVAYIAHTRYGARALGAGRDNVFFLYEGFDANREPSAAELRDVERRYALASLSDFVYPEQVVPGAQGREALFRRAVHDFAFLERFCAEHDVGVYVNNLGPELLRRCMFRMRDQGGPEVVGVEFAPLHGRFALTTLETGWDELPDEPRALTTEERDRMVAFVAGATAARKPFYPPGALSIKARNFVNVARYAKRFMAERADISLPALIHHRAESVVRVRAARTLYQSPVPGERFYFFPLHLADDSAITIRAPQFQRQEEIVRYIAERVLPAGAKLYVKPHIAAMHAYSYGMLREMATTPGVRLVDARIVAHGLIRDAEAMIVINSTVGFESLLYGKPVVALGRVFYRGRGLTTDVDQLADLPQAVARAVATPPDMERIYRFLHACHEATYPGQVEEWTAENAEKVADALVVKAARMGRPVGAAA